MQPVSVHIITTVPSYFSINLKIISNLLFLFNFQEAYDEYGGRYGEYEPHTGDPTADLKYEQMYKVPDVVKKFLVYFRNVINDGLIFEIQNLYENT